MYKLYFVRFPIRYQWPWRCNLRHSDNLGQSRQHNSNVKRSESRREIRSPFSPLNGVPPLLSSYLITHAHTRPHQGPRTGIKLRRVRRFVTYNAPLIDQPDPPWSDVPLLVVMISSHSLLQLSAPDIFPALLTSIPPLSSICQTTIYQLRIGDIVGFRFWSPVLLFRSEARQ